ncbi:autotransporter outer membrane beta-barrel domain-containing protein [Obesumbacterium proteus]|uniref:autotransporter outer membrane beta-barrel domain-containing protein n=1 Tax=Obesumbacterium proteus TaxID=82983 RepID=UPI00103535EB|nr:autotransporter outer membrane beta-barrel domain-containing protein [Obesumbacterium proteus]TBL77143.1 autotransporter outer membrane beta-barrel domain-containing protein [Obesumbacterium proteus]
MSSWKKKTALSRLALACSMAIAAQAAVAATNDISGTTYETYGHDLGYGNHVVATDGSTVDQYVDFDGYVGWNNTTDGYYGGDIYPVINKSVVNGVISTYYLAYDSSSDNDTLNITNSTIHGMVTSSCVTDGCNDIDHMLGTLQLTVDNSTIDDTYEHYDYDVTNNDVRDHDLYNTYALGNAITLDQEANVVIQNNSHIAGITLKQGYYWADDVTNNPAIFTDTLTVKDSVVTSGAYSELDKNGFYGQSARPSDYSNSAYLNADDVALAVIANPNVDNSMQTTATFDHSTLTGDVIFSSNFDHNFYAHGYDSNGDGVRDTNGWDDQDSLTLKLDNGSKWVGAAASLRMVDSDDNGIYDSYARGTDATADLYDYAANSIWPGSIISYDDPTTAADESGYIVGNSVYQSGLFDVTLDHGSEWDTRKASNIDTLTLNNGSQVNVENSSLVADSITLNNASSMQIGDSNGAGYTNNNGYTSGVATNALNINSGSQVKLTEETASLYANTITVTNGGELNLGLGQTDTHKLVLSDGGVLNVGSREYVLNSDMDNVRHVTNDVNATGYDHGVVAINSDGHLAVNGDVNGNYNVRIDNATGKGSIADYKDKEVIRVYDNNTDTHATFTAGNKADLGAYTYEAQQRGDTVVLNQRELTDAANMALSIPSANANIWHMEQDTLERRQTQTRDSVGDAGGAWVSYFGGHVNADGGAVNYDQDINGVMIGVDKVIDGNYANWLIGMSAGFAKGDINDHSGSVDQDSQSARIYSSAKFDNNIFLDSSLSYAHYSNDLDADMSNGDHTSGSTSNDGWGFGLKLGYDIALDTQGKLSPYASVSGLFMDSDSYRTSNGMAVNDQSYDSMRYEAGINADYRFDYANEQSLTPYFNLAYVYDDAGSNHGKINGDKIDNGQGGSAVRVGAGGQFNFTKNFSTYAGYSYLGGSDVDQPWALNAGVKYSW